MLLILQLGTSPLHFAAMHGHVATAEVLLKAGISRDARTKVDRTPLHVAAQEGHGELVDLLVRNGADIEAKDMVRRISNKTFPVASWGGKGWMLLLLYESCNYNDHSFFVMLI